jgi:hypothetical protein
MLIPTHHEIQPQRVAKRARVHNLSRLRPNSTQSGSKWLQKKAGERRRTLRGRGGGSEHQRQQEQSSAAAPRRWWRHGKRLLIQGGRSLALLCSAASEGEHTSSSSSWLHKTLLSDLRLPSFPHLSIPTAEIFPRRHLTAHYLPRGSLTGINPHCTVGDATLLASGT